MRKQGVCKDMNEAIIIICTRPDSKRIPNKCFKMIAGQEALEHILYRITPLGIPIVLGVPLGTYKLYSKYESNNIQVIQGNAISPLHRMNEILLHQEELPRYIIRITHDDILIDAPTIRKLLNVCLKNKIGYAITPSIVEGAGVEVICVENILHAAEINKTPIEHISYFVKGDNLPNSKILKMGVSHEIKRNYRLTLDYPEDVVVLETILRATGPFASTKKIVEFCDQHSSILKYNRMPLISFYTCVRNGNKYIAKTVESVLNSGIDDFEYIIIDDQSDDNTLIELSKFLSDKRIKIDINEENKGLASSSNKALSLARGKYVIRVDADDILLNNAIPLMLNLMKRKDVGCVYSNYHQISEKGKIIKKNCDGKEHHHAGCALMNKRFINEIKFREGLRNWDSLELYKRISKHFKVAYLEEPMWLYRQHKKSMSKTNLKERERGKNEINAESF